MKTEIKYIELKSGYSDNGPAWIAKVALSKSKQTIYFNDKAFQKTIGIYGNYFDVETGYEYWISGMKKDGTDRHWAGNGKIFLDRSIVSEYLKLTGKELVDDSRFEVVDIPEAYPVDRINNLENQLY